MPDNRMPEGPPVDVVELHLFYGNIEQKKRRGTVPALSIVGASPMTVSLPSGKASA